MAKHHDDAHPESCEELAVIGMEAIRQLAKVGDKLVILLIGYYVVDATKYLVDHVSFSYRKI